MRTARHPEPEPPVPPVALRAAAFVPSVPRSGKSAAGALVAAMRAEARSHHVLRDVDPAAVARVLTEG